MTQLFSRPEVVFATQAVAEAIELVRHMQAELVSEGLTKSDRSPVTVGDFAAQAIVAARLAAWDAQAALVGEEDAAELRTPDQATTLEQVVHFVRAVQPDATPEGVCDWVDRGGASPGERFWTLDPIDGTRGFLRREQYVTALAHIEQGQVRLGVLGCPHVTAEGVAEVGGTGCLMLAAVGEGCWVAPLNDLDDWRPARVSDCTAPGVARLLGSYESRHTDPALMERFQATLGLVKPPLKLDSQAKYALMALGAGELLVRFPPSANPAYREKIWDHAAGALCVTEAGGRATDVYGRALDFAQGRALENNQGILVSNGLLHEPALEALGPVLG